MLGPKAAELMPGLARVANAKGIYCRASAGLLTYIVPGIHAELAKHRALAVAVPGPAVVNIFPPPVYK